METTPNEMRNHQFASSMRGYNKAEVDAFVQGAADALEEARAELQKLREDKISMAARLENLVKLEESIKSAIIEAQKTADQIRSNARKEAELIVAEAKQRRNGVIEEQHTKIAEIEAQMHEMDYAKRSFYAKLRAEILAHLKLVDSIMPPSKPDHDSGRSGRHTETYETKAEPSAHKEPPTPEPEPIEMKEEEIENVVDHFGESSEELKEEVKNGQSQGNDF
ncbi:MAG: DivIVA domain-containing protein [Candidatus Zixiibacteriota bacterium]